MKVLASSELILLSSAWMADEKNTFSIVGGFEPVIFPRLFCFLVPYQQGEQNYPAVEFGTDGFHSYNCFTIFIGTILVRK